MMDSLMLAIHQFHFLRPFWLFMLIPCAFILLLLFRQHRPDGSWQNAIAPDLLKHLLHETEQKQERTPLYLLMAGWILATIAIAGPTWKTQPTPVSKSEQPMVIVVDLSLYMLAEDVKPNRMARARYKLQDLIRLQKDGAIALVSYAGSAHIVAPLTDDDRTLINLVKALNPTIMPVQGNKPAEAIKLAVDLLQQGSSDDGEILLVTGTLSSTQQNQINEILSDQNIRLSVLGVGTAQGAPIPLPDGGYLKDDQGSILIPQLARDKLTELARKHGGAYRDMTVGDNDLKTLLPQAIFEDDVTLTEQEFDQWHDAGYWLILLLLPLALAGFRRGWLTTVLLTLMLQNAPDAMAAPLSWTNLWENKNQQAQQTLESGDAATAAELFTNPRWKAQALYQNQRFEESAALLNQTPLEKKSAADAYNQGNAFAKAGKLPEAVKAYDQALAKQSDFKDAQFNKNIVEQMLKQQEQQQNQDKNNQNKQDQNQQQKQDQQNQKNDQQQDQEQSNQQDQQNSQQNTDDKPPSEQEQQKQEKSDSGKEEQKQEKQQKQQAQESQPEKDQKQAEQEAAQQVPVDQDDSASSPEKQAVESWLRTIPDDPGGLLRRKFLQQQQQREQAW